MPALSELEIINSLRKVATTAKLKIDPEKFACAISNKASVVNIPLSDVDLSSKSLSKGVDVLLVALNLPDGSIDEVQTNKPLKSGVYKARIKLSVKNKKGSAILLDIDGNEVIALPLIASAPSHPIKAAAQGNVSAHVDWCGCGVDALIKHVVIAITIRWC